MKTFSVRLINGAMVVALVFGYNSVLTSREQKDEIARLSAQLESARLFQASVLQNQEQEAEAVFADGVWFGKAEGFGGNIGVNVKVEHGHVSDIEIVSAEQEDGPYLEMAKDIIPEIIKSQSADVDTISGATFSSAGIRDAAAQALEEAGL